LDRRRIASVRKQIIHQNLDLLETLGELPRHLHHVRAAMLSLSDMYLRYAVGGSSRMSRAGIKHASDSGMMERRSLDDMRAHGAFAARKTPRPMQTYVYTSKYSSRWSCGREAVTIATWRWTTATAIDP